MHTINLMVMVTTAFCYAMQDATSPTPVTSFRGIIISKYYFFLQDLCSPICFQNKPVLFPN